MPQGYILGPLFFLIYINDIADNLLSITRIFFLTILLFPLLALVCRTLRVFKNHDLHIIANWSRQWLVDFNPNKTEAMLFTLKRTVSYPKLVFNNTPVNFVEHQRKSTHFDERKYLDLRIGGH